MKFDRGPAADEMRLDIESLTLEEVFAYDSILHILSIGEGDTERNAKLAVAYNRLFEALKQNPDFWGPSLEPREDDDEDTLDLGWFRLSDSVSFHAMITVNGEYEDLQGTEEWLDNAAGVDITLVDKSDNGDGPTFNSVEMIITKEPNGVLGLIFLEDDQQELVGNNIDAGRFLLESIISARL